MKTKESNVEILYGDGLTEWQIIFCAHAAEKCKHRLFDKRRIDRFSEDTKFQGQVRHRPVRHVQLIPWSVLGDKAEKLVIFLKRQRAEKTTNQVWPPFKSLWVLLGTLRFFYTGTPIWRSSPSGIFWPIWTSGCWYLAVNSEFWRTTYPAGIFFGQENFVMGG